MNFNYKIYIFLKKSLFRSDFESKIEIYKTNFA